MQQNELIPILQMSVGPVILISGAGLLLLSMTNRYGRAIDRARQLADAVRSSAAPDFERLGIELKILLRRARLLRTAIALGSLSVLLAAVLILLLFLSGVFKFDGTLLCALTFMACVIALVLSLIWFLCDINISLHALEVETRGIEQRISQQLSAADQPQRK